MSDLISREDAIEALKRAEALVFAFGYHNVIGTIRELPTIDPVKHGKWEMLMGWPFPEWRCSQCGNHICGDKEHLKKWNYCPNCGARMRGEEDECMR